MFSRQDALSWAPSRSNFRLSHPSCVTRCLNSSTQPDPTQLHNCQPSEKWTNMETTTTLWQEVALFSQDCHLSLMQKRKRNWKMTSISLWWKFHASFRHTTHHPLAQSSNRSAIRNFKLAVASPSINCQALDWIAIYKSLCQSNHQ